jgi:hypothetical protein
VVADRPIFNATQFSTAVQLIGCWLFQVNSVAIIGQNCRKFLIGVLCYCVLDVVCFLLNLCRAQCFVN